MSEINDAGGIGGSKIELVKLDTKDQSPDVMKTVMQNLVSQDVAAIFMPFCSYTSVEFPIIATQKVPAFHVNTWHRRRRLGGRAPGDQHLPGRPQRAVLSGRASWRSSTR